MTTYNPGKVAGESWREDYAAMLLSFDRSAVSAAILSFIRTEMSDDIAGADEDEIYVQICVAFVKLYQRQAIDPIRPLSQEGERQLDELLRNFNVVPGSVEPDAELTFMEQVVQDWNTIGMDAFGKKRRSDAKYEAAYVKAIEQGKIA